MLAVCLLTADRPAYTERTLRSFAEHNPNACMDHILLHADDGSASDVNIGLAGYHGFHTCYASSDRRGVVSALRFMWRQAIVMGATHILHLENDIEFCAPLPTRRDAQSVRLYGRFKGRDGWPTGPYIMGTKEPIRWEREGDGWERGICHWGAQPSITRASLLHFAIERAERLKDVSTQLLRIDTLRPGVNLANHFGTEKTDRPNFGVAP